MQKNFSRGEIFRNRQNVRHQNSEPAVIVHPPNVDRLIPAFFCEIVFLEPPQNQHRFVKQEGVAQNVHISLWRLLPALFVPHQHCVRRYFGEAGCLDQREKAVRVIIAKNRLFEPLV